MWRRELCLRKDRGRCTLNPFWFPLGAVRLRIAGELGSSYIASMSTLTFQLPEEIVAKLAPSPEEAVRRIKTELALSLYSQGVISHAEACQVTCLTRFEFEDLLAQRDIVRPYTPEMLREDLRHPGGDR
jgi:predicted HTH domain antitoxin